MRGRRAPSGRRATVLATVIVGGGLVLAARTGSADEAVGPLERRLTLAEARAEAEKAPAHGAAAARHKAVAAEVAAAGAWPATSLSVSTSRRTARLGISASLPLPVFGTRAAERRAARADLEVAGAELCGVDAQLRRDATSAWLELARAEARAALSEEAAARQQAIASTTRIRFDEGDAPRADVVAADAATRRARARARADWTAIGAASARLAATLGWDADQPLRVAGELAPLPALPPLAELRGDRTQHPSARAAGARIDAETARVIQARRERWPALSLDVEGMVDDPTLPGSDYRVGMTLELPIFGRGRALERAAAARLDVAAADRRELLATLDGELVAAYRRYQAGREQVSALETDVLPTAREATDLARAAYREGQSGLVGVLEAERAVVASEAELLDARIDAALALADLEWAAGKTL